MNTLLVILASTLTLVTPEDGAKYDTHSPCVKEFLANPDKRSNPRPPEPPMTEDEIKRRDEMNAKFDAWVKAGCPKEGKCKQYDRRWNFYERNAWTEDLYKRSVEETKTWKPFTWKADFPVPTVIVEFSETEDFAKPIAEKIKGEKDKKGNDLDVLAMRPSYLKVGTPYFWRVKAKDADGKEVVSNVGKFTTVDVFPRMIGTPDRNWRDHGGGVNADGKRIRQGMIYRTNAPTSGNGEGGKATPESSRALYVGILGVKSQVDLRGEGEAENAETRYGRLRLDKCGINVKYFPVDPYHLEGYTKDNYAAAIKFFANKDNYPILYNCAAGCDRTGSIGMLIDGILNRTDEQIFDDYELPSFTRDAPRLRYCRKARGMFGSVEPNDSDYGNKPTMRENIIGYLLKIGVTQEEIDSIRKIMIEE